MDKLNNIEKQIKNINYLLDDEEAFEKFIQDNELPEKIIDISGNRLLSMKPRILSKIRKKVKYDFIRIIKIACFTILAVFIWEVGISKINYSVPDIKIQKEESNYEKFNNNFSKISESFMNIDFKRGEKNNE